MRLTRFACALLMLAVPLLAGTSPVSAQDFPNRPLHLIVPTPSGTSTDIIARLVANELSQRIKQAVVVDNKTGAGGLVGVNALKQATPDGYTFGLLVSGNVIQPWLQKDIPFDVRRDFTHLTLMYTGEYILTVPAAFPANTLTEFIAFAKANPKKVFFGSAGTGTTTHLSGEKLKQAASVEITHIPFKGSPAVYAAMLGGDVQAYFDLYGTAKPLLDGGRVRALGVTSRTRMAALPQVPAIAESYPGFEVTVWTSFAYPAGTPKTAVERLTADLRAAFQVPELRRRLAENGVNPGGNSPEELTQFINGEFEKWGKTIQAAGLKPE